MKRNPIDELPEETQETILAMCEVGSERSVVERLSRPEPEGLGLVVSRTGLHGWMQRKRRERMLAETKERLAEAERIRSENQGGSEAALEEAMMHLLQQRLFEEATGEMDATQLQGMYRLAKQERWKREQMELARRKVEAAEAQARLARERLQLNAAKLALAHADQLKGLITAGEVGDGEKLQGALARLFGEKFAKAAKAIPEGSGK